MTDINIYFQILVLQRILIFRSYNGTFNFSSYGYNKYFETNKIEAVITNDFLFSSNDFINLAGISTNYNLLLKNSNDYTDMSSEAGMTQIIICLVLLKLIQTFLYKK